MGEHGNRWPMVLSVVAVLAFVGGGLALPFASGRAEALGGAQPAAGEAQGQYVGSQTCAPCHADLAADHAEGPHAVTDDANVPAALRGCESCHGPGGAHAAGNLQAILNPARLEPAEVNATCLTCHGDSRDSRAPREWQTLSGHQWLSGDHAREGLSCLSCHSEHGGGATRLREQPPALCTACHAGMGPGAEGHQHAPVAAGLCTSCHNPHGSARPGMAKADLDTTCASCHAPGVPAFVEAHGGYDLTGASCASCHTAHGGEPGTGGLPREQHLPFAAPGGCAVCHETPQTSAKPALRGKAADLCLSCHPGAAAGHAEGNAGGSTHFPVEQGFCLGCHNPHVGRTASAPLFKDRPERVCVSCHAQVDLARSQKFEHPPVAEGGCLSCHVGHASEHERLLERPEMDLCRSCHPRQQEHSHPVGVRLVDGEQQVVLDPRTGKMLTCAGCHDVHGGPHEFLTQRDWQRDLCIQCHRF